jgi:hypothetical protein
MSMAFAGSAFAATMEDLSGSDWIRMSLKEKQAFVYTGIGGLERQGVVIMKKPQYYIEALDKILKLDPDLGKEYLDSLFVFCVHESEPQTRDAIRRIREASLAEGENGNAL